MNEPEIQKIPFGIILPFSLDNRGGVCHSDGCFIENSRYYGDWLKLGGKYSFNVKSCTIRNEKVIFLGFCMEHWGHFLVDCLGRSWILCSEKYKDYKLVFLMKHGKKLNGQFLEFFTLLGINSNRFIYLEEPVKFSEVLIPECIYLHKQEHSHYRDVFNKIIENFHSESSVPEKVYFSRCHLKKAQRTELGEKDIERQFVQNGYEIFYPETLSLKKQIEIFQGSKSVACVNGTIPLNCLFAKSSIDLIVLNKMSLTHTNLIRISHLAGITPILIDAYYEPIKGHPRVMGGGPFWLKISNDLRQLFENRGMNCEEPLKHPFYEIVYRFMFVREHFLVQLKGSFRRIRNILYDFFNHL